MESDSEPTHEKLDPAIGTLIVATRIKLLYFAASAAYRYQRNRLHDKERAIREVTSITETRVQHFLRATLELSTKQTGFNHIKIDFDPPGFYPKFVGGMRYGIEGNEFGILVMIWRFSRSLGFADYYSDIDKNTAIRYLEEALETRRIVESVVNSMPGQYSQQMISTISDIYSRIPGSKGDLGVEYLLVVQVALEQKLLGRKGIVPHWTEVTWG
ncbi:MAG: hypothetical protein PHS44_02370 [Candidatus Dojkabacteria bacterium]|nr:hypothetical protein [Candidatus Dojkabacteria bacterium]